MKLYNTLITIVIIACFVTSATATNLNGRVKLLNNDGTNYKVMLQINATPEPRELGGATVIIDFDNTLLSYPDNPEMGIDFIFNNFNMGFYDTAKVTKVTETQIWINVDLISDDYGTMVNGGPYQWTDLILLNFVSNGIVTKDVVFWNIYSSYWGIYDSDNSTTWEIGNFDNIVTSEGKEISDEKPSSFALSQNFPNPYNPTTTIEYYTPQLSWIKLVVYNSIGQEIQTLVDGEKPSGLYEVEFNAASLPSGVYFYRLEATNFVKTRKMILMK